jgi:hypothetical protein
MLDDSGGDLELDAGSRRIEIRARGYETVRLDAKIVAGRTITYRGVLERVAPRVEPKSPHHPPPAARTTEPAPLPKQTFYLIPGCYLGNIPPEHVRLPAGCDVSRVVTWPR